MPAPWSARSPLTRACSPTRRARTSACSRPASASLGPRLAWARAESAQVAADAVAAAQVTPETAWQNINGLRGLDAPALAAAIELAAWRQRTAIELDRPLGQIVNDKQIIELARSRPTGEAGLRNIKGLSELARRRGDELVAAIAAARPADVPTFAAWRSPSTRAQRWSDLLLALVHVISDQTGVAGRLIATRTDVEEFARTVDEHGLPAAATLPALATWRRAVIGELWSRWLRGEVSILGDLASPHGIKLGYDQPTQ